jgi:phosphatidylinositol-3-phosphatase
VTQTPPARLVAGALGALAAAGGLLAVVAPPVGADSFTPIQMTIAVPPSAQTGQPLTVSVKVTADAGALDPAEGGLEVGVKLAPECGGDFETTPGDTMVHAALSPAPAAGKAYSGGASGSGTPTTTGTEAVCVYLEDTGADRVFANDESGQVMVTAGPPPGTTTGGKGPAKGGGGSSRPSSGALARRLKAARAAVARARRAVIRAGRALHSGHGSRTTTGRLAALRRFAAAQVRLSHAERIARAAARRASGRPPVPRAHARRSSTALPPIRHVFVIVLENESADETFGPDSPAPYLSKTLRAQGAYLPNYYGVGHESNDNYIAMISGQAPSVQNQADCQIYGDLLPGTIGPLGQAIGTGCIYPAAVPTIASQLTAAGETWRDYNESMGADPTREASVCGHPAVGSADNTQKAEAGDMYATRHNPFVYFHSIIDDTALCDTHVVGLDDLSQDLSAAATTPNYSFITPNLCDDGHDSPCADGEPGGLTSADAFLKTWVPRITSSPAFTRDGLLIVTFDEADTDDATSCCGEIAGPNSPMPGITGPGGGDIGTVLLSPFIAPGTVSQTPYNHYSMLGSVENIFGLSHLGYAQLPGETYFGSDVYTRPQGPVTTTTGTGSGGATGTSTGPGAAPGSGAAPPAAAVARRLKAARAAVAKARRSLLKARRGLRANLHGSRGRHLAALRRVDAAEVRLSHARRAARAAAARAAAD